MPASSPYIDARPDVDARAHLDADPTADVDAGAANADRDTHADAYCYAHRNADAYCYPNGVCKLCGG